ncbi:hypothetical protein PS1_033887 [Malus domestica]
MQEAAESSMMKKDEEGKKDTNGCSSSRGASASEEVIESSTTKNGAAAMSIHYTAMILGTAWPIAVSFCHFLAISIGFFAPIVSRGNVVTLVVRRWNVVIVCLL